MAGAFLLVLLTAAFGLVFALPVIIIPWFFAPRNPTPMKRATFEAGQVPTGNARVHLMMQYYPYLLIFVVFAPPLAGNTSSFFCPFGRAKSISTTWSVIRAKRV